ncbi:hypothetical protein [Ciceribacter sp. RN22]|uniref:hypothetical protein n=1 Tax=Ciceribacter sp. RN22 TaxID=2954932 RepID=UPI002093A4B8|nr:hypothetical protein [Ciceribacter sp. RN22]MCO6178820.1 hypothetical protein [Ciceribacter sp. RN22]
MLIVTAPSSNRKLTTTSAVKLELKITGGGDDAYLSMLIDQASSAIEAWCDRVFAVETVREVITRIVPAHTLVVSRWPVLSVTSVSLNGSPADPIVAQPGEGGLLCFWKDGSRMGWWPGGRIEVEYQAGYVLPGQPGRTLPADIERAALTLIKAHWFSRNRDPLIRSETVDDAGSTDYFPGTVSQLPPEVESLLAPYRNLSIG